MISIPIDIADDIGCSAVHIYKINDGSRKPSLPMAARIIEAMRKRGHNLTLKDLRPDLADFLAAN